MEYNLIIGFAVGMIIGIVLGFYFGLRSLQHKLNGMVHRLSNLIKPAPLDC